MKEQFISIGNVTFTDPVPFEAMGNIRRMEGRHSVRDNFSHGFKRKRVQSPANNFPTFQEPPNLAFLESTIAGLKPSNPVEQRKMISWLMGSIGNLNRMKKEKKIPLDIHHAQRKKLKAKLDELQAWGRK